MFDSRNLDEPFELHELNIYEPSIKYTRSKKSCYKLIKGDIVEVTFKTQVHPDFEYEAAHVDDHFEPVIQQQNGPFTKRLMLGYEEDKHPLVSKLVDTCWDHNPRIGVPLRNSKIYYIITKTVPIQLFPRDSNRSFEEYLNDYDTV